MEKSQENSQTIYTDAVKELVAIGAAIGVNCEPCFKFHWDKARKLGISREDISKAVETAKMVKDVSSKNVLDLAYKHLGTEQCSCESQKTCCS